MPKKKSVLDKGISSKRRSGYDDAGVDQPTDEPQPESSTFVLEVPKPDLRWVTVALGVSLLAGVVLAFAWHRRPGQDVQPKDQTTIEYEPLEESTGSAESGGESRYHRVLDRLRSWRSRRK